MGGNMDNRQARILVYDIETSAIVAHVWGMYQTDVIRIIEDWDIICFAYKWLGEKKTHFVAQWDFPDFKPNVRNDKHVVEKLWELFNEADAVIAHNGKSFDEKKSQARMMIHHMPPPVPFRQIDTKQEMKKVASHSSNKLSDLAKALELDPKEDAGGYSTWINSMAGDKKAQRHFKKYNIQDVETLEELYLELRPWIKNHPQMNVLTGRPTACPKCGSKKGMHKVMKYKATNGNRYQYYRCKECGGMSKSRVPEESFQKMQYVN